MHIIPCLPNSPRSLSPNLVGTKDGKLKVHLGRASFLSWGCSLFLRTSPAVFAKEGVGVTVCAVDVGVSVPICVWICV